MSIVIGLTGPTGAGKSSLTKTAEEYGFKVIDCDKSARIATEKGSEGLSALVKAFGEGILNSDGTLNRKALAEIAFKTPEKTELLNKTLLPFISRIVISEADCEKVLLDAPTLFESGIDSICSFTVAVLADKDIRLDRIMKRDNIDKPSALLRISAGKPDDFYIENSDYYIYNNSDEALLIKQFKEILNKKGI